MSEHEDGESAVRLFRLGSCDTPWGDYGGMLFHGMASWRESRREALPLVRTGPFVPPITFPAGAVVVTADFKKQIQAQKFAGANFRRVQKEKIVKLNWHKWNLTAKTPAKYPPESEPENYIYGRKHNEELSQQIGDLWEMAPMIVKGMVLDLDGRGITELGKYAGQDVCLPSFPVLHYTYGAIISPRFKAWIEENAGEWVSVRQVYPPAPPRRKGIFARLFRR